MTAQELKYDFLVKKDRVQSLSTSNFNDAEIDWFINEAQIIFLKNRLGLSNSRKESYEMSQKRIDDLSDLHIKYPIQPYIALVDHQTVYELPLSSLKYTYFTFLRGTVFVKDGTCTKEVALKFTQSDDMNEILKDPFNNASVEEFIPFNFGKSTTTGTSIYIYPADLILTKASVEYIKTPSKVSQGTYTYLDGVTYPEATLEFSSNVHSEIVDLAVEVATIALQDPSIEYAKLKTLIHE